MTVIWNNGTVNNLRVEIVAVSGLVQAKTSNDIFADLDPGLGVCLNAPADIEPLDSYPEHIVTSLGFHSESGVIKLLNSSREVIRTENYMLGTTPVGVDLNELFVTWFNSAFTEISLSLVDGQFVFSQTAEGVTQYLVFEDHINKYTNVSTYSQPTGVKVTPYRLSMKFFKEVPPPVNNVSNQVQFYDSFMGDYITGRTSGGG